MTITEREVRLVNSILQKNYDDKKLEFSAKDVLHIISEFKSPERYIENAKHIGPKYKVIKHFVDFILYQMLTNRDATVLCTAPKGCLSKTEDTVLQGENGPIKTVTLKDGDIIRIKSFDFESKKECIADAYVVDSGKKEVYEIELIDGRKVQASEDHTFFVYRRGKIMEVALKDIKKTDRLVAK